MFQSLLNSEACCLNTIGRLWLLARKNSRGKQKDNGSLFLNNRLLFLLFFLLFFFYF